jgi:glycosyltransferase involved in cell wall biosynthesis
MGERNDAQGIVVIIPAYNEERFIGSVVLKARQYADTVVVVDDGSADHTAEIAEAAGAIVERHEKNLGKGAAMNTGFRRARTLNPRAVVVFDADGQHLPEELNGVIAPVVEGQADIVVGSRYLEERSDVPRHRVMGHWAFNLLTRLTSGVRVTDSQSGFRAFSPRALEGITFSSEGFSVESEMQFLVRERDLRLSEVPITIRYEEGPKRSVIAHGMMVLNGILRLIGQYRPLLFFGLPGAITLVVGIGWGGWVVHIYQEQEVLAIGYALISVLLCIVGSLSLFAGVILHSVRGLLLSLLQGE